MFGLPLLTVVTGSSRLEQELERLLESAGGAIPPAQALHGGGAIPPAQAVDAGGPPSPAPAGATR